MAKSDEERFWSKVEKTESCWNWDGNMFRDGYGQFWSYGAKHLAHRVAWIFYNGPIINGCQIDHICHNRRCVNPAHLREVTPGENMQNLSLIRKNNSSGYRGVTFHKKSGKYQAQVKKNGKFYYAGSFDSAQEANLAAIKKRNEIFTHNDVDRF